MLRTSLVLCGLLGVGAAGTGCAGTATVRTHAYVETASPDLVYVSPGVYVVADYDEPVFYSSGSYWLYRDGFWFRSHVHTGGWARAYSPPVAVRSIHRPSVYVRYRASGRVYRHDNRGRVFVRGDRHRPVRRHYR